MNQKAAMQTRQSAQTPPTTPPAIGPAFDFLWGAELDVPGGREVEVGWLFEVDSGALSCICANVALKEPFVTF